MTGVDIYSLRNLEDTKKACEDMPTPLTHTRLIEKYIEQDNYDKAMEIADVAISKYPNSEAVRSVYNYLMKYSFKDRITDLREWIAKESNPRAVCELVDIYRKIGDIDSAYELLNSAVRESPDYEDGFLLLGEMRLVRLYEDYLCYDGLKAKEFLEKVLILNEKNYKALVLLAELYLRIGAQISARRIIDLLLHWYHSDEKTQALKKRIDGQQKTEQDIEQDEDIEGLFKKIENERCPTSQVASTSTDSSHKLKAKLKDFENVKGLIGLVIFDRTGNIIGKRTFAEYDDEKEKNLYEIYKVAQDSSLRMDIGSFNKVAVQSPRGYVYLVNIEDAILAVLSDTTSKIKEVERAVFNFIENTIYLQD